MRTLEQFLSDYGDSHQNPVNQWVHFFCVPIIFFSTLGLLWLVPIGQWLGLEPATARWVNGATLLAALSALVYLKLSFKALLVVAVWFALSVWGILALEASSLSLGWTSLALWIGAWIVQVWGHKVEGKKPSFIDDLVFLLIGPIFVCVEIAGRLGLPVRQPQR